jgi:hypothetical protein
VTLSALIPLRASVETFEEINFLGMFLEGQATYPYLNIDSSIEDAAL